MTSHQDTHSAHEPTDAAVYLAAERIVCLETENVALREAKAKLTARVAELEQRLGLNSGNSSKPPSPP
ncbi:hypothetical protein CCP3SC5AM1_1090001 [Gammaproteobacteria bacterium]